MRGRREGERELAMDGVDSDAEGGRGLGEREVQGARVGLGRVLDGLFFVLDHHRRHPGLAVHANGGQRHWNPRS